MSSAEHPIGIFDSGIGGLTVLREILSVLPDEHTIYLGDTARVPYGIRSPETVTRYSFENVSFLLSRNIKMVVIACNTASSISLEAVRDAFPVPVVGVIDPGARAAVSTTRNGRIGVIGTEATIRSNAYTRAITRLDSASRVFCVPCPLFVPLVEEGWTEGEITEKVAERYLAPIRQHGIDTLVLGCTHYPLLKDVIRAIMGEHVSIIDSAVETAIEVRSMLGRLSMLRVSSGPTVNEFFVTDSAEKFLAVGQRFLGRSIETISAIKLAMEV